MYDELFDLPEEMTSADEEVTSHDLWMLAGQLTNSHNTAKANKQAVRYGIFFHLGSQSSFGSIYNSNWMWVSLANLIGLLLTDKVLLSSEA